VVCFINCLKHTKGQWYGQSFDLIDWQEQIVRDIFGILKPMAIVSLIPHILKSLKSKARVSLRQQQHFF